MICNKIGCRNDASSQVGFRAWAQGFSKETTPIDSYLSLAVCDVHKKEITVDDITTPQGRTLLNNRLTAIGKCALDFSTAEVVFHDIIDDKLYMPGE